MSILITDIYRSTKLTTTTCTKSTKNIDVNKNLMFWAFVKANRNDQRIKNSKALKDYLEVVKSKIDFYFNFSIYLNINPWIFSEEESYLKNIIFEIGMAIGNINAKKILKLKHLYHCKLAPALLTHPYVRYSKKTCDFIAEDDNHYYLIEAKGTAKNNPKSSLRLAYKQLNGMVSIRGKANVKYASCAYIDSYQIKSNFVDPIDDNEEEIYFDDCKYEFDYSRFLTDDKHVDRFLFKGIETENVIFGVHEYDLNEDITFEDTDLDIVAYTDGLVIGLKR